MKSPKPRNRRLTRIAFFFDLLITLSLIFAGLGIVIVIALTAYHWVADEVSEKARMSVKIPAELPDGTVLDAAGEPVPVEFDEVQISVPFALENRGLGWFFITIGTAYLGLVAYGLFQLRQFVRSLHENHPFVPANAARLRRLAWVVVAAWGFSHVGAWVAELLVVQNFTSDEIILGDYSIGSFEFLLFALVLFMIAEVFKIGVEMKAEQDLTI